MTLYISLDHLGLISVIVLYMYNHNFQSQNILNNLDIYVGLHIKSISFMANCLEFHNWGGL